MSAAILFDRNQVEHLDDISDRPRRLSGSKLLWVDLDRRSEDGVSEVAEAFDLDDETRALLAESKDRAVFRDLGRYLHVSTYAPTDDEECRLIALECVVGENWVVTAHDEPIPVLDEFAARVSGSGDTGSLEGPSSSRPSWTGCSARTPRLSIGSSSGWRSSTSGDARRCRSRADIERLIAMRQQVGKLRRALAAHRSALVSLTYPELEALGDAAASEHFQSLLGRFESTMQEARDAREAIVGSSTS